MSAIKSFFAKLLLSEYVGSFVRHWLTTFGGAIGGWLVAKNILNDTSVIDFMANHLADIILAVALYFVGQGSSIAQKKITDAGKVETK